MCAANALRKGYIIEGSICGTHVNGLPRETLESALLNAQLRDGFVIIYTNSLEHTAHTLQKIQSKIPYDDIALTPEQYLTTIKTVKKNNLTPDMCYKAQLIQIPQVSTIIAQKIAEHYPTMARLIHAVETQGITILANLDMGTRRLGLSVAQKIADYLQISESKQNIPNIPNIPNISNIPNINKLNTPQKIVIQRRTLQNNRDQNKDQNKE